MSKYKETTPELVANFARCLLTARRWAIGSGASRRPTIEEACTEKEYLEHAYRYLVAIYKRLGQKPPKPEGQWYLLSAMPEVVEAYIALYLGEEGREVLSRYSRPGAERL